MEWEQEDHELDHYIMYLERMLMDKQEEIDALRKRLVDMEVHRYEILNK